MNDKTQTEIVSAAVWIIIWIAIIWIAIFVITFIYIVTT